MAKKTFKNTLRPAFDKELNPAMNFISTPEETKKAEQVEKVKKVEQAPEGYKLNPLYVETKSRRLQLLLQPSLYEKVKKQADLGGLSVNEFIHSTLEEATKEEQE